MKKILISCFVSLFFALGVLAAPALAQNGADASSDGASIAESGDRQLKAVADQLSDLAAKIAENKENESELAAARASIEQQTQQIASVKNSLQSRLNVINDRLKAIGDAPAEGSAPEDSIITRERTSLQSESAAINSVLGRAEDLTSTAARLNSEVSNARQSLFTSTLFKRTTIDTSALDEAREAYSSQSNTLVNAVSTWLSFTWNFRRLPLLGAIFFSCLTALIFVAFGYRVFGPFLDRSQTDEVPFYITRLSVAFWSTVLPSASTAAFAASIYFFMDTFGLLRFDIEPIVAVILRLLVVLFFVVTVTRAVLEPTRASWRLVTVSNRGAWSLFFCALALALINAGDYLMAGIYSALGAPLVLTIANSFLASLLAGLVFIFMAFIKPLPNTEDPLFGKGTAWPPSIRWLLVATGLALIVAALSGYVGLARFVSSQIVLTGALLVTMWIGFVSGKAVSQRDAIADTDFGKRLQVRFKLSDVALDQLGLAFGLGIYFLVLLLGIPLIMLQWGFYAQDIWIYAQAITSNIQIGSIQISLVSILVGILIFLVGLYFSKWLLRWVDNNVLARSNMDAGVRNSVSTGLSYVGAGVALLIGVSAAGINLSNLALVAGALSLGIGFGLQNIVSNFVSGLILLVERPFKVGDWVVTGTTEGIVKHISVRATEIETFQNQSIIVPNSELINASLGNWTHRNKLGRTDVAVGVSYDSDPERIIEILLEIGRAHPKALKNPEPSVEFAGFGDSSLDFTLRIHLANVLDGFNARNDLRLAVFKRFKEEGIEIPFPQRDINVRVEELEKLQPVAPKKKPGPKLKNPARVPDNMGGLDEHEGDGDGDDGDAR
ncbi:mechanosensitive ion channel domain-containing protein [Rhizobium sp. L1K21]|uniref:mechanosensitive ion channel domain-containing protein n=1 Tax=Rhizobium sp. L1K21 TaxID=2954933 RepID=UPI002092BB55|nr:mechanosensitive ion channel domain-containing protein [Rhizobium sp. L1K21]MCO6185766.1 mechanosensitive ion channel [Rhizobium sp. L1K21]